MNRIFSPQLPTHTFYKLNNCKLRMIKGQKLKFIKVFIQFMNGLRTRVHTILFLLT